MPPGLQQLWDLFLDLSATRAPAMAGVSPIAYAEIVAWQRAHRIRLESWEVDLLRALDRVALEAAAGSSSSAQAPPASMRET